MKILLVDDETHSRQAVLWFLKRQNHEVTECACGEDALEALSREEYPMVLSDIQMPGISGIELTETIKKRPDSWRTDVVLFTGYADLASAISALRAGVYDYLEKPVNVQALTAAVERVGEHQALLRENKRLTERFEDEVNAATEDTRRELSHIKAAVAKSIIGAVGIFSTTMQTIAKQAQQLHEDRSIPVLIEGETGVGKEVIAKIIHYGSEFDSSSVAPFVDINCAALAPTLFESELFGYEAGSFTGGVSKGSKGKFDLAQGGTLFLDEIGELPLELQGKLLRVLQEKEFYRVGGLKKIKIDVRIICATNEALEEMVTQKKFRQDLYFRLKVAHLVIPPLRTRKEAILPMASMFLQEYSCKKRKNFTSIDAQAAQMLEAYGWPGNVCELQNVMEYVVFAYNECEVKTEHLINLLRRQNVAPSFAPSLAERALTLPFPEQGYSLKDYTAEVVLQVLAAHNDNQTAAANYLGISRRALSYRLEEMRNKKQDNKQ